MKTGQEITIQPMPAVRVPAYFRQFSEWYAEALREHVSLSADAAHLQVEKYLNAHLDPQGTPRGSMVFDLIVEEVDEPVGATWCGGANLGFGELFYIHDLRIYPPYRRRGFAQRSLRALYELSRAQGGGCGLGLSVLARNLPARELYAQSGFEPLSQVLFKTY